MSMILGSPTMPHDVPTGRYVLSIKPTVQAPPRDGLERLARVLAKPVWSQADRDRMKRAADGLTEHRCKGGDCPRCAMAARIDAQVGEWDRIRRAPPIPSTAQLRNALRRPDRSVRAARLYRDISERSADRWRRVVAAVKPYRTVSVRLKHERIATDADPTLRRLERARARLERIQPDVAHLARTIR